MQPATSSDEISFGFDELFFSRTDPAGIIKSGNSVFQRVSIYPWAELLGAPHKIVRHPGTPRAVFWLLWRALKSNQPIGAYVKNRAKDGRFYWVFALATPVREGYLSVRLRPSSALFQAIKPEYDALANAERGEGLTPEASANLLLARLNELGFSDYPSFMATALGSEIVARDGELGRKPDAALLKLQQLRELSGRILDAAKLIANMYASNEHVPMNFRVLAAQLGDGGEAIGVIATNYSLLSTEIRQILEQFTQRGEDVRRTIDSGYFLTCIARLQREVGEFFAQEKEGDEAARESEVALLDAQRADYAARAREGLAEIAEAAVSFQHSCLEMRRLASGLEVTRVMSVVECARHPDIGHRTTELLNDLQNFQKEVSAALKEMETINQSIVDGVTAILEREEPPAFTLARAGGGAR